MKYTFKKKKDSEKGRKIKTIVNLCIKKGKCSMFYAYSLSHNFKS